MANASIHIPCCEMNGVPALHCTTNFQNLGGFSFFISSNFATDLNVSNVKKSRVLRNRMNKCGAITASSKEETDIRLLNGGLLEDFQFKPSFNEYLRAMESVRTSRYKKQSEDPNKSTVKDNESGQSGKRIYIPEKKKNSDVQGNLREPKMSTVVEQKDLFDNVEKVARQKDFLGNRIHGNKKGVAGLKNDTKGRVSHLDSKVCNTQQEDNRKGKWLDHVELKLRSSDETLAFSQENASDIKMKGERVRNGSYIKALEKISTDDDTKPVKDALKVRKLNVQREQVDGRKIGQSHRGFSKSGKAILESIDGTNLEVERAAFRNLDASDGLMDNPRVSKMEMEVRIQMLAKRLNGADIDTPEWLFSQMMRSAKIRYSDHSILRVIQVLGKLGNWRRVIQVIEWLQMRERFKSHKLRFIYTTALDVLGKARRPVEALNVFRVMLEHFSSYPDIVAYHSIAVTLGQAGYMRELFDVIDSMQSHPKKKFKTGVLEKWDPRLKPDIVIYNAVLNACVKRKNWEGAFWVLQQLKQQGVQPSTSTYGLVMEVMLACGKYNLVHAFFRKLQKSSVLNALTYKVLINTLWEEDKTDEAVMAIQDMERRGIVGSAALYYDFARCLCSAGRCEEALIQIEKICRVASKPLVVTYTGLIQACLDSRNLKSAVYIFNQMKSFCSPNLVTYNVMLKGFLEHEMFEEAKELFRGMLEQGRNISSELEYKDRVLPDIYTFNTMLDASFTEKKWDDFGYFYQQMLLYGYHFNPKRHLRLILEASRAGKDELLEITWKHLDRSDRTPPPSLIKERFCMKLARGDYSDALSCISKHHGSDAHHFSQSAWLDLLKEKGFQKDSVFQLMSKVSLLITRNDMPCSLFQNLLLSCKEYCSCRTILTVAENKLDIVGRDEDDTKPAAIMHI